LLAATAQLERYQQDEMEAAAKPPAPATQPRPGESPQVKEPDIVPFRITVTAFGLMQNGMSTTWDAFHKQLVDWARNRTDNRRAGIYVHKANGMLEAGFKLESDNAYRIVAELDRNGVPIEFIRIIKDETVNPSGAWRSKRTWMPGTPDESTDSTTLMLQLDGEVLSGYVDYPEDDPRGPRQGIFDASYKDGELCFSTRKGGMSTWYGGKLIGDTITGGIGQFIIGGAWQAERIAAAQ
jgi:hypothetical protein